MLPNLRRAYQRLKRTVRPTMDTRFLQHVAGVVHVGANTGQERAVYDSFRIPVLWIEPIPEVFATLKRNLAGFPHQQAIQALVADADGQEVEFHVASNDGASSSMLAPARHGEIWPAVTFDRTLRLTTQTLPSLLEQHGVDIRRYDGLVMDTQRSELRVLKGAEPLLQHFRFIKTEAADFESYVGCCRLDELDAYLRSQGFEEFSRVRFRNTEPGKAYYEVVYRRRDAE